MNSNPNQHNSPEQSPRDTINGVFEKMFAEGSQPIDRMQHGVKLIQDMNGNHMVILDSSESGLQYTRVTYILEDQPPFLEVEAGINSKYFGPPTHAVGSKQLERLAQHLKEVFTPDTVYLDENPEQTEKLRAETASIVQGVIEEGARLTEMSRKAGDTIIDLTNLE